MSGLCGLVEPGAPPSSRTASGAARELLRQMAAASIHRGPQAALYRASGGAELAELEPRPTVAPGRGGRTLTCRRDGVWVAADVRLDERRELVRALGERGLEGAADVELLLAAYRRWGVRACEHLLGDFAFALWDEGERRLLLVRDALGVKPLHYARAGEGLVFASEAQQILEHPAVGRELDEASVGEYLCGLLEDPRRTFFRHVRRLPPAHRLVATATGVQLERFWDVDPERRVARRRRQDHAEEFREIFGRAVADRLAPGATAVALSGGLDSSAVAAAAVRDCRQRGVPPPVAGSFVFERLAQCDERSYQRAACAELGLEAVEVVADRHGYLADANAYTPDPETPFLAWESCYRELLGRLHARGVEVLLTGCGGDEVAGGSPLVWADRLARGDLGALGEIWRSSVGQGRLRALYRHALRPFLPAGADRALRRLAGRPASAAAPSWIAADFARRTGLADRLRARAPRRFAERSRQSVYLASVASAAGAATAYWHDRRGQRFGIEVRHPFLDRRLIEHVLAVPPEMLFRAGAYKPLLQDAMAGLLPEAVRTRGTKTRLGAFVDAGLRDREARKIEKLLQSPLLVKSGYVDGRKLLDAYRSYRVGPPDDAGRAVWYAITFELWLQRYRRDLEEARHRVQTTGESLSATAA